MGKKGKVKPFPGPRGPMLPRSGVPGVPGTPDLAVVKQKISEIDWYKWRVAVQKEQTLIAKQNELQRYKDLLAKEEENFRLRIQLIKLENHAEIGHLNLGPGDTVVKEGEEYFLARAPRRGPIPSVNGVPAAIKPEEVPEPAPLPPVPSTDPDDEEEEEDGEAEAEEAKGAEQALPEPRAE